MIFDAPRVECRDGGTDVKCGCVCAVWNSRLANVRVGVGLVVELWPAGKVKRHGVAVVAR